jgi:hypothetical protein
MTTKTTTQQYHFDKRLIRDELQFMKNIVSAISSVTVLNKKQEEIKSTMQIMIMDQISEQITDQIESLLNVRLIPQTPPNSFVSQRDKGLNNILVGYPKEEHPDGFKVVDIDLDNELMAVIQGEGTLQSKMFMESLKEKVLTRISKKPKAKTRKTKIAKKGEK